MRVDAIELEVFHHRLSAIAEEMGSALCRSAFSPNIKERRDFSCALFDADGKMAAQAAHIPVHLGSTALSVAAAMEQYRMRRGDVVMLNDPFAGGTHLPDLTLVAPVFLGKDRIPFAYVANRAHHADIGGSSPGSMPLATEIYQEGLRLPPVRLCAAGELQDDLLRLFLANTRVPDERRGDLHAQLAALQVGQRRIGELVERIGRAAVVSGMTELCQYSARLMRAALRQLPPGAYTAEDWLDDDGAGTSRIAIRVRLQVRRGSVVVDFAGTDAQVPGGVNANFAVTLASVLYCLQLLSGDAVPANAGLLEPVGVLAPRGSVVNACFPSAVAGGNVETSQRIVDVVLRALAKALPDRIPAASCGSMNNLALGGYDALRRRAFAYYETIGGGAGAGPGGNGADALHTHMTNTLNTPIEAIESAYPLRLNSYAIRRGSGGRGRHRGGEGIRREVEFLAPTTVTLLTERRSIPAYGLNGGNAGAVGRNLLLAKGRSHSLPAKVELALEAGQRLLLLTPGGGGWGRRAIGPRAPSPLRTASVGSRSRGRR